MKELEQQSQEQPKVEKKEWVRPEITEISVNGGGPVGFEAASSVGTS